ETKRALDMREDLLAVPGIDAVMVGPADLSISLGVPGQFPHPKMVEAMEAIRDTCNRRGIAPGTHTRTPSLARFSKERGMRCLGCNLRRGMPVARASALVGRLSAPALNGGALESPFPTTALAGGRGEISRAGGGGRRAR